MWHELSQFVKDHDTLLMFLVTSISVIVAIVAVLKQHKGAKKQNELMERHNNLLARQAQIDGEIRLIVEDKDVWTAVGPVLRNPTIRAFVSSSKPFNKTYSCDCEYDADFHRITTYGANYKKIMKKSEWLKKYKWLSLLYAISAIGFFRMYYYLFFIKSFHYKKQKHIKFSFWGTFIIILILSPLLYFLNILFVIFKKSKKPLAELQSSTGYIYIKHQKANGEWQTDVFDATSGEKVEIEIDDTNVTPFPNSSSLWRVLRIIYKEIDIYEAVKHHRSQSAAVQETAEPLDIHPPNDVK